MKTGIIFNEPFPEYLASDSVGSHKLEDLRPRPLVYFKRHVARTIPAKKSSPALEFGRLFHCLALEGEDTMNTRFAVIPFDAPDDLRRFRNAANPSPKTVASIKWWDQFEADTKGKDLVSQANLDLAWKMVGAIRAKQSAVTLLARGKPEVTFRHALAGFSVQARVDWFDREDPAGPLLVNVKTVESLEDFDDQYYNLAYYKSDAFYRLVVAKVLGVEAFVPQCVNLVVEKSEPFECAIRVPDAEALDLGTREVMRDMQLLKQCYETGVWPGEPDQHRTVSLPEWVVRRMQEAA